MSCSSSSPSLSRRCRRQTLEDLAAAPSLVDADDPPVRLAVAPLDEAALLHPVDDPGRAGDRDVERLGELAHRQRALGLEDRQDVEVDEAERAAEPAAEHAHPLARVPGRQLVEQILDYPLARESGSRRGFGLASIFNDT